MGGCGSRYRIARTDRGGFRSEESPTSPIRLLLPPTGSLRVRNEDEQGKAMPDGWVHVTPILPEANLRGGQQKGPRHDRYSKDGLAFFSHVEVGFVFEITAQTGNEYEAVVLTCQGPKAPGEEVAVTLRSTQRFPVLTGRVLGEQGQPLSKIAVEIGVAFNDG